MFDPHSTEFRMALIAGYQAMLQGQAISGDIQPAVILAEMMSGRGAPRFRAMSSNGWDAARTKESNSSWVPVARVDVDGSVERLLR